VTKRASGNAEFLGNGGDAEGLARSSMWKRRFPLWGTSSPRWEAALQFAQIRLAVWAFGAFALLWAPIHDAARIPPFRAYGPLSDLIFGTFAQWDAVWFIHVADDGYDSKQVTAFFPLYPWLTGLLAHVTQSTLVSGVTLSLAGGVAAAWVLRELARTVLSERAASDSVFYLALYPIGYVFTSVYSDGPFLAFATGAFLAAQRRRPVAAGVAAALAVSTRFVGIALVPTLVLALWPRPFGVRGMLPLLWVVALPLAALGAYAAYLDHRFGDPFVFAHAESVFWTRQSSPLGPVNGFWDAVSSGWHGSLELLRHLPRSQGYPEGLPLHDRWAAANVLHAALLAAVVALTWVAWLRLGAAYGAYSVGTLAIILASPAAFVPLVSFPRFVLGDFPVFLALAAVTESRPRLRRAVLLVFAITGGAAAVAFSRKVWVA
jgi:hypothetical protein